MTPVLYSITQIFMGFAPDALPPAHVAYERPSTPATATRIVDTRTPRAEQRPVQAPRTAVRTSMVTAGVIPQSTAETRGPAGFSKTKPSMVSRINGPQANNSQATHHPKDYSRAKDSTTRSTWTRIEARPFAKTQQTAEVAAKVKNLKPVNPEELITAIHQILELSKGIEMAEREPTEYETSVAQKAAAEEAAFLAEENAYLDREEAIIEGAETDEEAKANDLYESENLHFDAVFKDDSHKKDKVQAADEVKAQNFERTRLERQLADLNAKRTTDA